MVKFSKWLGVFLVLGLLASCYPEKERSVNDFDIVGTRYFNEGDFSQYKTYYLYDSLIIIYDTTKDEPEYPSEQAQIVMDNIKSNLLNYGWLAISADSVLAGDTPDVYIEASTWNSTVTGAVYYPGWGYPGYPGWGYPGYPWYPGGGVSYYQYTTGTVLINMLDVKNHNFNDIPPELLWNGGVNGILTNSTSSTDARLEYSINKAFEQSPYLNL